MSYFRVQAADRDANDLLDPGYQFSHAWAGIGYADREGVSVCESLEDLAEYLASPVGNGIPVEVGSWVIVELEGDPVPDAAPVDPEYEVLVRPTAIVSVWPVDDAFIAMIDDADEFLASFSDPNDDEEDEDDDEDDDEWDWDE